MNKKQLWSFVYLDFLKKLVVEIVWDDFEFLSNILRCANQDTFEYSRKNWGFVLEIE